MQKRVESFSDILKYKNRRDMNLDLFVSLKNEYIYFMVCKAASSSVTYHLRHAEYLGSQFQVKQVNNVQMSPHLLPFQFTDDDFVQVLNSESMRKIAVVRNPYTRLLSCYLHRIAGEKKMNPSKRVLLRALKKTDVSDISFEMFIDCITGQDTLSMERHWIVQHDCILYPLVKFDFIGKQENLVADLISLESLLFSSRVFDRALLPSRSESPRQTNAADHLKEHYNDRLMARVVDRYKADFEAFDYDTDLPR